MNTLRRNDKSAEVVEWQKVLAAGAKPTAWTNARKEDRSWPAAWAWPLGSDGSFGERTQAATEAWQFARKLVADGVVGPATWAAAGKAAAVAPAAGLPFVRARNFTVAQRTVIDVLVIHVMESQEKGQTAENVASWFAGPDAPKASAHYCVDADSIVQCVLDKDVAWHAEGANRNGIGIEHAGMSKQTAAEWEDVYSRAMLERSAKLSADLCRRYAIPVVRLSPANLIAKQRGLCGHIDCTNAFSAGKGHYDPGPSFPWDWYLERVQHHFGNAP